MDKIKTIIQETFLIAKFKIFVLTLLSLGCLAIIMDLQIQALNSEMKNLWPLIESLEETQKELKNQLLLKDQQIAILENTIVNLKTNIATLSYFNETENFEFLREEVMKANNNEIANFYLKLAGLSFSFVLIFLLANNFKEIFFTEVLELKFVDSVNNLMWMIRIPDSKKADLIVKKINLEDHDQIAEFVKTVVIKTTDTVLKNSPDGIELISSSASVSERIMAATHITDILNSVGWF